jgi:hypothetical protein
MSTQKTEVVALLPADEARDLVVRAAAQGVATPEWLGYLILLSAYGPLHPEVRAFEARAKLGQDGTQEG